MFAQSVELDTITIFDVNYHIQASQTFLFENNSVALQHALISNELAVIEEDSLKLNASFNLGNICFYLNLLDQATTAWITAAEIAKQIGDQKAEVNVSFNLTSIFIVTGKYQRALERLLSIEAYYKNMYQSSIPNDVFLKILNNKAIIYGHLKEVSLATALFNQGFSLIEDSLNEEFNRLNRAYINFLLENQQIEKAESVLLKQLATNSDNPLDRASNLLRMGYLQIEKKQFDEAKKNFSESFSIAKELELPSIMQRAASALSDLLNDPDSMKDALFFKNVSDSLLTIERYYDARELASLNDLRAQFSEKKNNPIKTNPERSLKSLLFSVGILFFVSFGIVSLFIFLRSKNEKAKISQSTPNLISNNQTPSVTKNKSISSELNIPNTTSKFNDEESFLERLLDRHPNLTQNERRLAIFLRQDLNTKEIIIKTGQSVRAVEMARLRLRKKIGLKIDENLNLYFMGL